MLRLPIVVVIDGDVDGVGDVIADGVRVRVGDVVVDRVVDDIIIIATAAISPHCLRPRIRRIRITIRRRRKRRCV